MVAVIVLLVESSFYIVGKPGPVEGYVRAAISLAGKRVNNKLKQGDAAKLAAQPKIGSHAESRLFRPVPAEMSLNKLTVAPSFGNPIAENLPGFFVPHPFIGYIGTSSVYPFRKDYFGFRNDEDMYFGRFDPNTRPEVLITWSGNSEAAGVMHERTVPQFMERILNQRDPSHAYRTLSMATNGHALNDEISAYVAVAYALKPEFSITHSGITDVAYGGTLPGGFKQLGLIYTFDAYYRWIDRIYDMQLVDNIHPNARTLNPSRMDDLIPGIVKSYERYRSIVRGNGGELLIGMPPYGKPGGEVASAYWLEWVPQKLKELHAAMPKDGFVDFTGRRDIVFLDTIHTKTETAKMYAEVYAEEILRRMKSRKLHSARKGADLQLDTK